MTVIKNPIQIYRFVGLSTDTKPTRATQEVPLASTFYAYDIDAMYITYDGTNWLPKDDELRRIRVALELILGQEVASLDSTDIPTI